MRLLTIMERHIRDGLHLQLQCSADQVRNIFVLLMFMYKSCPCASLLKNLCWLYLHVHVYVAANFLC